MSNESEHIIRHEDRIVPDVGPSIAGATGGAYLFRCVLLRHPGRVVEVEIWSRLADGMASVGGHDAEGELVGLLKGYLVDRPSPLFFQVCDELEQELQELSVMFCDSHGRATRVDHPRLARDSPEAVMSGGFFHIFTIEVAPAHRGKDLGLRAVHEALLFLGDSWALAVMKPVTLNQQVMRWFDRNRDVGNDATAEACHDGKLKLQRYFARMGFTQAGRNRGLSSAFFLTNEMYFQRGESHTGRNSAEAAIGRWVGKEDAARTIEIYSPPPRHEITGLNADLGRHLQKAFSSEQVDLSALWDVIRRGANVNDARALHICAANCFANEVRLSLLFEELVRRGGDVNLADEDGNRPLHVAAASKNSPAVTWLVSNGANANEQNADGKTPLDVLVLADESSHDFLRTFGLGRISPREVDVVPKFDCIKLLMMEQAKATLIDGWLSPRMHKMLSYTADLEADMFMDSRPDFKLHHPLSLSECVNPGYGIQRLDYIPASVLRSNPDGFYASFHDGYGTCFEAMSSLLRRNQAPTFQKIHDEITRSSYAEYDLGKFRHFLAKGGKIEYALDALLGITENVMIDGDDGWEYETFQEEIEALPASPLDGMFDVARFMCINRAGGSLEKRGPHEEVMFWSDHEDVEDDEDDCSD